MKKQRAEEKTLREEEQNRKEIEWKKCEKRKEIERRKRENAFTVPKLGYRFELFKLNNKSLPLFASPQNRRRISPYQVPNLCKILYNGNHFDSPTVVNKVKNLLREVDGNHTEGRRERGFSRPAAPGQGYEAKMGKSPCPPYKGGIYNRQRWNNPELDHGPRPIAEDRAGTQRTEACGGPRLRCLGGFVYFVLLRGPS